MQKKKAGEKFTANVSLVKFWGEVCTEVVNLTNKLVQSLHKTGSFIICKSLRSLTFSLVQLAVLITNQLTWLM